MNTGDYHFDGGSTTKHQSCVLRVVTLQQPCGAYGAMADASPVRPEGPLKKDDPEVPGLGMFTSENTAALHIFTHASRI